MLFYNSLFGQKEHTTTGIQRHSFNVRNKQIHGHKKLINDYQTLMIITLIFCGSLPLPARLSQSFLLHVYGCWQHCGLQLCLILLPQALQIRTQTVSVQFGVSGSLQEAGGQVVYSSLLLCFRITVMFSLENNNKTQLEYCVCVYPALN